MTKRNFRFVIFLTNAVLLFLAAPAISTYLFRGKTDRFYHIVDPVISQRGELKLFAYHIYHFLILFALGIYVFLERFSVRLFALKLCNYSAGYKLHFGGGAGEA